MNMFTLFFCALGFLAFLVVLQQIMWYFERKDLYNRLMSKNIADFKINTDKVPPIKLKKPDLIQL